MRAAGMYPDGVTWREVPKIYKARFRTLWRVLKLSLLAAVVMISGVVLVPFFLGVALFSGHFVFSIATVGIVVVISGWLYWKSLRIAFGKDK